MTASPLRIAAAPEPFTVVCPYREVQVLRELMKDGADNRTIGRRLNLGEEAVKTYLQRVYRRTLMPNRTALVVALFREELVVRDSHGETVEF